MQLPVMTHNCHEKTHPMITKIVVGWQCLDLSRSLFCLTHWGLVICAGNLAIIGSDNGLSPDWRQAIIWTNAGISLIGSLGTNFSEILIKIHTFSFKKIHFKTLSAKWCSFCRSLNVLMVVMWYKCYMIYSHQPDSCWWPGAYLAPGH